MSGLFDTVKAKVDLVEYVTKVGVTLRGRGDEVRGWCPLCRAGEASKSTPFKIRKAAQDWYCFLCEKHGDVVTLHRLLGRFNSPVEAAQDLAGGEWVAAPAGAAKAKPETDDAKAARRAAMITSMWSRGKPLVGTPGEAYLLGPRHVDPDVLAAVTGLRFNPEVEHHWDDRARVWVRDAAIVVRSEAPGGWAGGVHCTYVLPDGSGKAVLEPAKRMWGNQSWASDAGVQVGGAWLIGPETPGDLVVGEGIETSLCLASWLRRRGRWPLRVASALSLNRLQGGWARDENDCVDVWKPQGDPARPAFTWPPDQPGQGVWIAIDQDMNPVSVRGRNGRGRPVEMRLDGQARAQLCARLASAAWRAAGWAWVKPMWPGRGRDWGDVRG